VFDDPLLTIRRPRRPYHRKLHPEPMRLLLRHADAGRRQQPAGLDQWQGLTALGHAQAQEIVHQLGGMPILRVLSSPALRCRQTVLPLAWELGLDVEPVPQLDADADPARTVELLRRADTENTVLCTHRETLAGVFRLFAAAGHRLADDTETIPAAATWALYGGPDRPVRLRRHLRTPHAPVERPRWQDDVA
jgi:phosphohistidine phosphatase SixA